MKTIAPLTIMVMEKPAKQFKVINNECTESCVLNIVLNAQACIQFPVFRYGIWKFKCKNGTGTEYVQRYIFKSVIDRKLLLAVEANYLFQTCSMLSIPTTKFNVFTCFSSNRRSIFTSLKNCCLIWIFNRLVPSHLLNVCSLSGSMKILKKLIEQFFEYPETEQTKKNCEKCFMWNVWTMKNEFQSSMLCNESEFPTYPRPSSASIRPPIKRNLNWTFVDGGSLTNVSSLKLVIHSIFNQCAGST